MSIVTYALVAVAGILAALIFLLVKKYTGLRKLRDVELSKEAVLGRLFLKKIKKISDASSNESPDELFRQLKKVMREFFSEFFDLSYEFAYLELNEEISKKGLDEKLRKEIMDYTMLMSQTEYSGHRITSQEFFFMLGKSIKVIRDMTGHRDDVIEDVEHVPAKKPETTKEAEAIKESIVTVSKKKEPEPKEPGAVPGLKKDTETKEVPSEEDMKIEARISVQKSDKEKIDRIRTLIVRAEENLASKKYSDAMDSYTSLRVIYDTLPSEIKKRIYPETRRIISIYNELVKRYKEQLLSS
ncbi:MAG: hypothetical protein J7K54_04710 [Candidatus Aenigmarchaeota archaeon]|nr:hypothetical protein [Candidatus Aenigmarchaeota archaeon]